MKEHQESIHVYDEVWLERFEKSDCAQLALQCYFQTTGPSLSFLSDNELQLGQKV